MLLLFASCLNCYVHGAFLFRGESCLTFIVKYKAVSFQLWEGSPCLEEEPVVPS